jgi:hypothetical protein
MNPREARQRLDMSWIARRKRRPKARRLRLTARSAFGIYSSITYIGESKHYNILINHNIIVMWLAACWMSSRNFDD